MFKDSQIKFPNINVDYEISEQILSTKKQEQTFIGFNMIADSNSNAIWG